MVKTQSGLGAAEALSPLLLPSGTPGQKQVEKEFLKTRAALMCK